jgi:hypothetical protein
MAYDLTPEARAFIAAQESRHVGSRVRFYAQHFDTAEDQVALLEHAVALRKRARTVRWNQPEVRALCRRAKERRVASAESAAENEGAAYTRMPGSI